MKAPTQTRGGKTIQWGALAGRKRLPDSTIDKLALHYVQRISGNFPLENSILPPTITPPPPMLALVTSTATPPSVGWSRQNGMAPIPFPLRVRTSTWLTSASETWGQNIPARSTCRYILTSRLFLFSADVFRSRPRTPTRACTPNWGDDASKWRTVNSTEFSSTIGTPFSHTNLEVRDTVCWCF